MKNSHKQKKKKQVLICPSVVTPSKGDRIFLNFPASANVKIGIIICKTKAVLPQMIVFYRKKAVILPKNTAKCGRTTENCGNS